MTESAAWAWPLDLAVYDRRPELSPAEAEALAEWYARRRRSLRAGLRGAQVGVLERLRQPVRDALRVLGLERLCIGGVVAEFLAGVAEHGTAYWAWSADEWSAFLHSLPRFNGRRHTPPQIYYLGVPYLLTGFVDFGAPRLKRGGGSGVFVGALARAVFGAPAVDAAIERVSMALERIGYSQRFRDGRRTRGQAVCYALLVGRSPRIEDVTEEVLQRLRGTDTEPGLVPTQWIPLALPAVSRALVELGILQRPLERRDPTSAEVRTLGNVHPEWAAWCARWRDTTTLVARQGVYSQAMQAGEWLATKHPEVTRPDQWTRPLCAEYVAAVLNLKVGDLARVQSHVNQAWLGRALAPRTRNAMLYALRVMFRELSEWGMVRLQIDPLKALATPRAVYDLIAPDARVIDDAVWLKLVWASLHLSAQDLSSARYPLELVRALAVIWTHAALRSDEIRRLHVGCIRAQHTEEVDAESGEVLPPNTLCYLEVPPNKTSPGYTKPMHLAVGEAIAAWEAVRPRQPPVRDPKTGLPVQPLFLFRGGRLGSTYINNWLIPLLCRKAGVPEVDTRGRITSHRARASTLTQLKIGGMTLFELQQMAGHRSPLSTLHYLAHIRPTQLARSFARADRTARSIEVLIDREAVTSGGAVRGEPWMYYDLGPMGFCANPFWSTCAHRLACPGCEFNVPRASTRGLLVQGRAGLHRFRQEVPLTEEECEAVDGDIETFDTLLARLQDTPTPDGRTPAQIETAHSAAPLPRKPMSLPVLHSHQLRHNEMGG